MLLSEALFARHERSFGDNRELDDDALRALESHFVRLPIPDCPMWTDPASGVAYGVRALMPGDWLM